MDGRMIGWMDDTSVQAERGDTDMSTMSPTRTQKFCKLRGAACCGFRPVSIHSASVFGLRIHSVPSSPSSLPRVPPPAPSAPGIILPPNFAREACSCFKKRRGSPPSCASGPRSLALSLPRAVLISVSKHHTGQLSMTAPSTRRSPSRVHTASNRKGTAIEQRAATQTWSVGVRVDENSSSSPVRSEVAKILSRMPV